MSDDVEVGAEQIMARVRAVLAHQDTGEITCAQKELFGRVAAWVVQFDMNRKNPILDVVDHIGNYWRNWLFLILHTGTYRPSKIARILEAMDPNHPISQRMLTLNLRLLERDGLVERNVVCDKLNHVEYSLTPMGNELVVQLLAVIAWVGDHVPQIADARARFDAANKFY